jgi:hypothetical protein
LNASPCRSGSRIRTPPAPGPGKTRSGSDRRPRSATPLSAERCLLALTTGREAGQRSFRPGQASPPSKRSLSSFSRASAASRARPSAEVTSTKEPNRALPTRGAGSGLAFTLSPESAGTVRAAPSPLGNARPTPTLFLGILGVRCV